MKTTKTRTLAFVATCLLLLSVTCSVRGAHLRRNDEVLQKKEHGGERPVPQGDVHELWQDLGPDVDELDIASIWEDMERDPISLPLPVDMVNNVYNWTQEEGFSSRIVGGGPAVANRYWFFSMIMRYSTNRRTYFDARCGASLVSRCFVLTAAHCVKSTRLSLNDAALVGALAPFNGMGNKGQPSYFSDFVLESRNFHPVVDYDSALFRHPEYNSGTKQHDLALIKLNRCLPRNHPIKPVKIARQDHQMNEGRTLDIMGFGRYTSDQNDVEDDVLQLKSAEVPYLSNKECSQVYRGRAWVAPDAICAGYQHGGTDSCQGDSGAPIVDYTSGKPVQVGVTSWGKGCALPNSPGVYVDLRHEKNYEWIKRIVCSDEDTEKSTEDLCQGLDGGGGGTTNIQLKCDGTSNTESFNYGGLGGTFSLSCNLLNYSFLKSYCDRYEDARQKCVDACVCNKN